MTSYVVGTYHLCRFYIAQLGLIRSLPPWMRNPECLTKTMSEHRVELSVSNKIATSYNTSFEEMKERLRLLHPSSHNCLGAIDWYCFQLAALFVVRLACIYTAWHGSVQGTFLLSVLQFAIAPYSLFVALSLTIALAPPIYLAHYLSCALVHVMTYAAATVLSPMFLISPEDGYATLIFESTLPGWFIVLFFLSDQLLCLYCHYLTPSVPFTPRKTLTHIFWGFLNTKTYYLVVFLHIWRAQIPISLSVWLCDWALGITPAIASIISRHGMHWLELFYHQHRMAHLPRVYEHAHKLHHYLHGTNAFDAHIYGNGMPEEFFLLWIEIGACMQFHFSPASLNRFILQLSWDNKMGHTQQPEDTCGNNHHTDHHLRHLRNFGIYNCLMDMYFGTNTNNNSYSVNIGLYSNSGKSSDIVGSDVQGAPSRIFDVVRTIKGDSETGMTTFTFTARE
eukprot:Rmarinus@m.4915